MTAMREPILVSRPEGASTPAPSAPGIRSRTRQVAAAVAVTGGAGAQRRDFCENFAGVGSLDPERIQAAVLRIAPLEADPVGGHAPAFQACRRAAWRAGVGPRRRRAAGGADRADAVEIVRLRRDRRVGEVFRVRADVVSRVYPCEA